MKPESSRKKLGTRISSTLPSRKLPSLSPGIDSSVAHALALAGLPVEVASSPLGSIHSFFPAFLIRLLPNPLGNGNDSCQHFRGRRLGLVGDQLAQERNQHDERNTDHETSNAKLGEEFRVAGVG